MVCSIHNDIINQQGVYHEQVNINVGGLGPHGYSHRSCQQSSNNKRKG